MFQVLCKNRYVGRSFIQPTTRLRQLAVARKFGPYVENIVGKRIVLVDDSIVRGTTMQPMVELLKSCGAKEVTKFEKCLFLNKILKFWLQTCAVSKAAFTTLSIGMINDSNFISVVFN